jgi:hypothetical protein
VSFAFIDKPVRPANGHTQNGLKYDIEKLTGKELDGEIGGHEAKKLPVRTVPPRRQDLFSAEALDSWVEGVIDPQHPFRMYFI